MPGLKNKHKGLWDGRFVLILQGDGESRALPQFVCAFVVPDVGVAETRKYSSYWNTLAISNKAGLEANMLLGAIVRIDLTRIGYVRTFIIIMSSQMVARSI